MKFCIRILILIILFLMGFVSTVFPFSANGIEKRVVQLSTEEEFGLVPEVRAIPVEKGRFIVELTFNVGDRWGRDGFARYLAKSAMERLFKSNLPLAQGVVKVYCNRTEVLHLAISVNQAKQIRWENESNPSQFFDILQSHICWGKKPEDCTFFIENGRVVKPSPAVSSPVAFTTNP